MAKSKRSKKAEKSPQKPSRAGDRTQKPKVKAKLGRPTDYREEYCKSVVEYMGKGSTFAGWCGHVGTSEKTGYEWIKAHDAFRKAKKEGEAASQDWLMGQGKLGMWGGKSFNPSVWIFMMKNMHKWTDRQEVKTEDTTPGLFKFRKTKK